MSKYDSYSYWLNRAQEDQARAQAKRAMEIRRIREEELQRARARERLHARYEEDMKRKVLWVEKERLRQEEAERRAIEEKETAARIQIGIDQYHDAMGAQEAMEKIMEEKKSD